MRKPSANLMILITLIAAAGMVAWVISRVDRGGEVVRIGFQDADAPLAMPENGGPDHRFHFLPAWQRAEIPRALRFDPPMGSEHGGLVYNAQKFWEMNEKRGGHHTGDDLNGIGGMKKLDFAMNTTLFKIQTSFVYRKVFYGLIRLGLMVGFLI